MKVQVFFITFVFGLFRIRIPIRTSPSEPDPSKRFIFFLILGQDLDPQHWDKQCVQERIAE
jgi:hypothetical protein